MSKHTPGPWEWVGTSMESKSAEAERTAPNYGSVMELDVSCGMWCQGGTARIERLSEADARLIAAAPDLLEALEKLLSMYESTVRSEFETGRSGPNTLFAHLMAEAEPARAAIARAKGESQ